MSIAKALFGLIGSALIGLLLTSIAIPEWTMMNLEQHFWQTVWGFLISAAFGGAVVFVAYATYMDWRLGSGACKAFGKLRSIAGLEGCTSLGDMVEPIKKRPTQDDVDELKREHARAIADRDAMISELEKRPTRKDVDDMKRAHAEEIAAKDAVIAKLETDMERRVDEGIKEHMECFMDILYKKVRAARDPDSAIRDRIESRELDPHSVRVLELVLKTGTVERRWLRDALDRGSVDVTALDLKIHDVGHYFRDLAEERGAAVDPYGRPAARFALKPDVADVLAANREVFKAVEDEDAATAEFLRDYKERTARGEARKAGEGARP